MAGIGFSIIGFGISIGIKLGSLNSLALIGFALCIQLRLLCNMMDGLVAVEGNRGDSTGALWNEAPDRIEDLLFLLGGGILLSDQPWGIHLGWIAASLALITAYIRALGGSLGLPQDYCGPMAKPHRMFTLTVGSIAGAFEGLSTATHYCLSLAMITIALGSVITIFRRLIRIHQQLQQNR